MDVALSSSICCRTMPSSGTRPPRIFRLTIIAVICWLLLALKFETVNIGGDASGGWGFVFGAAAQYLEPFQAVAVTRGAVIDARDITTDHADPLSREITLHTMTTHPWSLGNCKNPKLLLLQAQGDGTDESFKAREKNMYTSSSLSCNAENLTIQLQFDPFYRSPPSGENISIRLLPDLFVEDFVPFNQDAFPLFFEITPHGPMISSQVSQWVKDLLYWVSAIATFAAGLLGHPALVTTVPRSNFLWSLGTCDFSTSFTIDRLQYWFGDWVPIGSTPYKYYLAAVVFDTFFVMLVATAYALYILFIWSAKYGVRDEFESSGDEREEDELKVFGESTHTLPHEKKSKGEVDFSRDVDPAAVASEKKEGAGASGKTQLQLLLQRQEGRKMAEDQDDQANQPGESDHKAPSHNDVNDTQQDFGFESLGKDEKRRRAAKRKSRRRLQRHRMYGEFLSATQRLKHRFRRPLRLLSISSFPSPCYFVYVLFVQVVMRSLVMSVFHQQDDVAARAIFPVFGMVFWMPPFVGVAYMLIGYKIKRRVIYMRRVRRRDLEEKPVGQTPVKNEEADVEVSLIVSTTIPPAEPNVFEASQHQDSACEGATSDPNTSQHERKSIDGEGHTRAVSLTPPIVWRTKVVKDTMEWRFPVQFRADTQEEQLDKSVLRRFLFGDGCWEPGLGIAKKKNPGDAEKEQAGDNNETAAPTTLLLAAGEEPEVVWLSDDEGEAEAGPPPSPTTFSIPPQEDENERHSKKRAPSSPSPVPLDKVPQPPDEQQPSHGSPLQPTRGDGDDVASVSSHCSSTSTRSSSASTVDLAEVQVRRYPWLSTSTAFSRRFGPLFMHFRPGTQWFIIVECAFSFCYGFLEGIRTDKGCTAIAAPALVVGLLYLIILIKLRPHLAPADGMFFTASAAVLSLCPVLLIAFHEKGYVSLELGSTSLVCLLLVAFCARVGLLVYSTFEQIDYERDVEPIVKRVQHHVLKAKAALESRFFPPKEDPDERDGSDGALEAPLLHEETSDDDFDIHGATSANDSIRYGPNNGGIPIHDDFGNILRYVAPFPLTDGDPSTRGLLKSRDAATLTVLFGEAAEEDKRRRDLKLAEHRAAKQEAAPPFVERTVVLVREEGPDGVVRTSLSPFRSPRRRTGGRDDDRSSSVSTSLSLSHSTRSSSSSSACSSLCSCESHSSLSDSEFSFSDNDL